MCPPPHGAHTRALNSHAISACPRPLGILLADVPECFAYFDALSYDLSKMDLTHFRQNAMRNDIMAGAGASSAPPVETI